ncbi:MAG: 16S rRNA (guanine(527)-N(7))-methyltransferase RsmG [Chloroflexi bacterium]|nr:16S rRNA (guanine(527)-N(7))-methyltransferase RsmG [Chloroflexota bacterium]
MTLGERAAALFGVQLSAEQEAQFTTYARLLVEWNAHVNLTAISDEEGIEVRHFLDSLSVVKALPPRPDLRLIDVGTGAGFPGLPLRIALPHVRLTLLEATGKKLQFVQTVIDTLALSGCDTLHARAEEAAHLPAQRGQYDVVLARAVARLPALVEYLLPFAKVGGRCIALKGTTAQAEAADARRALALLGGRLAAVHTLRLPGVADEHALVVVEKTVPTPAIYPRKPGIPTRKPL